MQKIWKGRVLKSSATRHNAPLPCYKTLGYIYAMFLMMVTVAKMQRRKGNKEEKEKVVQCSET